jgi:hypothetical protein
LQHTSEKANETFEWAFATYVYNHYNICNISIYFYNIHMKHLQHTSETIETYSCNMRFQRNTSLLLSKMEARRCVVFTEGSGPVVLVAGGSGGTTRKVGIGRTSGGEATAA